MDWIDVGIDLSVPGIRAHAVWAAMPRELSRFAQELRALITAVPGAVATMRGVERGWSLSLELAANGHILGRFALQPAPPDGAHVEGCFGVDQTYLGPIAEGADQLAEGAG